MISLLQRAHGAILDAFVREELQQHMTLHFDQRFTNLVADKAFAYQVAELLRRAEDTGNLLPLLRSLAVERPALCVFTELTHELQAAYGDLPPAPDSSWGLHDDPALFGQRCAPFMAEAPPVHFVARPKEYEQLIAYLLAGSAGPVAITASLKGAGGFGKTTLAQAICHDERIRAAFPDGILWVTIGDDAANVLVGLRKLYVRLTSRPGQFVDQQDAVTQLSAVLADRRCLMVIDDVWNPAHLQPFLQGGRRCARLVTTRVAAVVPLSSSIVNVDAMELVQATSLLGSGLPAAEEDILVELARQLGEWPLLLSLVNRRLYEDVVRGGLPLRQAVAAVQAELREFGLTSFDVEDAQERSQAVAACMGASLQRLRQAAGYGHTPVDEVARFLELAVFPEDTVVPVSTVAKLWGQTGSLSPLAAARLCRRLADLSLILRYDPHRQTILLHDVTRRYLIDRAAADQYCAWQRALLSGYSVVCDGEWWRLPDDGYVYQQLLWHLIEAGQRHVVDQLLQSYRWLAAKLRATHVVSLLADFDLRSDPSQHTTLGLLQQTVQLSASVLARSSDELASQLYGRLAGQRETWSPLLAEIVQGSQSCWLRPKTPTLTPPGGALLFTLSGHTDGICHLLLTPDGRLVSSCRNDIFSDAAIKVWDLDRGVLLHSLAGHARGAEQLLLTADGRLISACGLYGNDHTIKVWDLGRGVLLHSLAAHMGNVANLLLTQDGCLVSACGGDNRDHSIKVWDIVHGVLLHSLEGHTAEASQLLLAGDGRLISSGGIRSRDHTIKVWDLGRGVLLHSLAGHLDGASNLLLTGDNRLISSCGANSGDHTIKVWDLASGVLLHSLAGHLDGASNLLLTEDNRLISSCGANSGDHTIKVWDLASGVLLHSLAGHRDGAAALLLTPGGQLISACGNSDWNTRDHTIKVWDLTRGALLHTLAGHKDGVSHLLLAADGRRLASACGNHFSRGSNDHTVRIWDIQRGVLLHVLEGHTAGVSHLQWTADGRLVSACGVATESIVGDTTIRVWDIARGTALQVLEGHTHAVSKLLLTPGGRLISACGNDYGDMGVRDHTINVWDLDPRRQAPALERHRASVTHLAVMPGGRLASACRRQDGVLKVWRIEDGGLVHALAAHKSGVDALLPGPDGALITCPSSTDDDTIKVWDAERGVLLRRLAAHNQKELALQALAPNGRLIACSDRGSRQSIKVWDLASGRLVHTLPGHKDGIDFLLLTPGGRLLSAGRSHGLRPTQRRLHAQPHRRRAGQLAQAGRAVAGWLARTFGDRSSQAVRVWNLDRGTLRHLLRGHIEGVDGLLLGPDGRLISFSHCGADYLIKIWDADRGRLLRTLRGQGGCDANALLTPGGNLVVSCATAAGYEVHVWDVARGRLLHVLQGHTALVSHLLLGPNGSLITACGGFSHGYDFTVKVWDIARGALLHSLEGHTAGVTDLLLMPDARLVTSSSMRSGSGGRITESDYTVKVWDLQHGVLLHSFEEQDETVSMLFPLVDPSCFATVSGCRLSVWNTHCAQRVAQFTADGDIDSCVPAPGGTIIVGDGLGCVHFLTLMEPDRLPKGEPS